MGETLTLDVHKRAQLYLARIMILAMYRGGAEDEIEQGPVINVLYLLSFPHAAYGRGLLEHGGCLGRMGRERSDENPCREMHGGECTLHGWVDGDGRRERRRDLVRPILHLGAGGSPQDTAHQVTGIVRNFDPAATSWLLPPHLLADPASVLHTMPGSSSSHPLGSTSSHLRKRSSTAIEEARYTVLFPNKRSLQLTFAL
jgi:hypothetical protein